jgi:hypothetical protein
MAGVRPQTALARAIVFVLIVKLIGLAAIKTFMFPDSSHRTVDATAMAAHVIGVSAPSR